MQVYSPNSGGAVDTSNLITNAVGSPIKAKIWMGTVAEYQALGAYDNETLYFTTDGTVNG